MLKRDNVLVVACTHIPFEHKKYLDFCLRMRDMLKCNTVIHLGDLVDNNAISYHEHDPNGWSPLKEMEQADKHLKKWFNAFPDMLLTLGNHDHLVDRKAKTLGLPRRCFKPFREMWNLPKKWEVDFEFTINNVLYKHGTGYSGKFGHVQAAVDARQSTVIAHLHATAGVEYLANTKQIMFGMCVGCGLDIKRYAFSYGKDFKRRPILGIGVVTDSGRFAQFMPMDL